MNSGMAQLGSTWGAVMIRVFVGYDHIVEVTHHVLSHSIQRNTKRPVSITPIELRQLSDVIDRPREPEQSNEFTFTRWLVPYLCNYKGHAIFMDCDMLLRGDINDLWEMIDEQYAIQCVKHDHVPTEDTKFLGTMQTKYSRKNWASVMIFNNARCKALTPEYVNTASRLDLHQFKWLDDDNLIGGLPPEWNHLVDCNPPNPNAKIVHFTLGGPYFNEHKNCEFADEWFETHQSMLHCEQMP